MKHKTSQSVAAAMTAIALCFVPSLSAQSSSASDQRQRTQAQSNNQQNWQQQSHSSQAGSQGLRLEENYHRGQKIGDLTGKDVRDSSGEKLGTISDFVVDAQSGKVVYAIVNSGGFLGIAATSRAVPFAALQPVHEGQAQTADAMRTTTSTSASTRTTSGGSTGMTAPATTTTRSSDMMAQTDREIEAFRLNLDKQRWESAPTFSNNEVESLTGNNRGREIFQHYGQQWQGSSSSSGGMAQSQSQKKMSQPGQNQKSQSAQAGSMNLMLASNINGKEVRSGNEEVGEIEDVIIHLNNRTAALVLDAEDDFAGTDETYVVRFAQLQFGQSSDAEVSTRLTRQDFQQAAPMGDQAWSDTNMDGTPYVWTDGGYGYGGSETRVGSDTTYVAGAAGSVERAGERAGQSLERAGQKAGQSIERTGDRIAQSANRAGEKMTQGANQATQGGQAGVEAVRQALRNDNQLRNIAQNVQVETQGDRLILRGEVQSQDLKRQVEQRARQVASGMQIDNQISVRGASE